MSPGFTASAPPRLRSSIVISWLAPAKERSTTRAWPMTWSRPISAVVIPSLNTCSGESMWAPVCRLWRTLDTCQNPGPRRCGVTSSRILVEGGLIVRSSTVTERSTYWPMRLTLRSGEGGNGSRRGGERIRPLSAMMPDIGDPAVALARDDGLIGGARLKIVVADQPHIPLLGLL